MKNYKVNYTDQVPRLYINCKHVEGELVGGDLLAIGYSDVQEVLDTFEKTAP